MESPVKIQLIIVGLGSILTQIDNKIGTARAPVEDGTIPFFPIQHGTINPQRRKRKPVLRGPCMIPENDALGVPVPPAKRFEPRLKVVWVGDQEKSRQMKRLREWVRQRIRKRTNWIEEAVFTPNEPSDVEILDTYFGNNDCYGK
jgi:hypothetical protein